MQESYSQRSVEIPVDSNGAVSASREPSLWFPTAGLDRQARLRLFCFPYAGGGNQIFRSWAASLPSPIEVCPVQLPGRGNRMNGPRYTNLLTLTKAIANVIRPFLDLPFAFFGHSMGATIAFELSRELRRSGNLQPIHLFPAAQFAPHSPHEREVTYNLPELELIEKVRDIKGTPKEVLDHPELMEVMIPLLRADFEMVESYTYVPEAPLDCPITVLGGLEDLDLTRARLEEWRQHTTASFSLRMLPGDHFFINTATMFIHRVLAQELYSYIK